ncbi:MAG TPA: radical SAM protein [Kiritimatiellia bacterium]|nr:radical SAM protein [Kiritimatiellia bacterium]
MVDIILAKVETHRPEDVERKRLAPPFALLCLADALEKAGFSVLLHHSQAAPDGIRSLIENIRTHKPIFVGMSVITPHILSSRDASQAIKAACDVPLIWGGVHSTIVPEQTAQLPFVDAVCIGEGEQTIVELARSIRQYGLDRSRLAAIPGLIFKDGERLVTTPTRAFLKDLNMVDEAWHLLNREEYFYPGSYFHSGKGGDRVAVLNTSRGCPYRCGYCYNQAVHHGCVRCRSAEKVLAEIEMLRSKYGVTGILFAEDNFFGDPPRALAIARGLKVPWSCSITIADILRAGEQLVDELARSGCVELRIGIEAGSPDILRKMRKPHNVEQALRIARKIADAGMMGVYMFMTGIPGETWKDTLATLDMIDALRAISDNIRITGPTFFAPYPATELFDAAVEQGFHPPEDPDGWSRNIPGNQGVLPPYADPRMPKLTFYRILTSKASLPRTLSSIPVRMLRWVARLRWKHRAFGFTPEHSLALWGISFARKLGMKRVVHPMYRRFFMDI